MISTGEEVEVRNYKRLTELKIQVRALIEIFLLHEIFGSAHHFATFSFFVHKGTVSVHVFILFSRFGRRPISIYSKDLKLFCKVGPFLGDIHIL